MLIVGTGGRMVRDRIGGNSGGTGKWKRMIIYSWHGRPDREFTGKMPVPRYESFCVPTWLRASQAAPQPWSHSSFECAAASEAAGVDALGYHIFNADKALLQAEQYRGIIRRVSPFISRILVSRITDIGTLETVLNVANFDGIQIQADIPRQLLHALRSARPTLRIIKTLWMGRDEQAITWIMHTAGLPNAGRSWLMSSRIE